MTKLLLKKSSQKLLNSALLSTLPYRTGVILVALITMTGCANLEPIIIYEPINQDELLQLELEIKQLKKVIQEKDAIILEQRKHQRHQVKAQQDTSHEATRTQLKLHRLATKPSAASTIAEVTVAMGSLNQISAADQALKIQAQNLLDAAKSFYTLDEYASSMNYAAQAFEIIGMVADQKRRSASSNQLIVTFQTPVMLRTITNVNLRRESNINSAIRHTLQENTTLIANAYQGNWFRVQTEDDSQGWVFSKLVTVQILPLPPQ